MDRWRNQAPSERIIVALDCSASEALTLARSLAGRARWLKVGMTLFYQTGAEIVSALRELGFSVFLDLKLHDIPHQVRGAALACAQTGAGMITIHSLGGSPMMEAACEGVAAVENPPAVLSVTILTSMDQQALSSVGIDPPLNDEVIRLARLAAQSGVSGVVASPHEAAKLREVLGSKALIVTPGVRPSDAASDDQRRVMTPEEAFAAGASHLVIGRPITAAPDPLSAFEAIAKTVDA